MVYTLVSIVPILLLSFCIENQKMGDGGKQTVQNFCKKFRAMKKIRNMMSKAKSERVFASLGTFVTFGHKSKE